MSHVLVAGCGDLGTEVALRLVDAGHTVTGLRRSPQRLPGAIRPLSADLSHPLTGLGGELAGVDVLVYAAAPDAREVDAYRTTYRDGLAHVLDAVEQAGGAPRRALLVSSTAVYGVDDGSVVDEDTPVEPTTTTGEVLVEAEQALWRRRPDACVLRLAGIYGPGRTRLLERIRAGEASVPPRPVHTNRIHRDDAARAVVHLLGREPAPAPCYLGVDDEPADRGEVVRFLARELGAAEPPVGEGTGIRGGDKRCSNARLRATGWVPAYPSYREGYAAVLAGQGARHA